MTVFACLLAADARPARKPAGAHYETRPRPSRPMQRATRGSVSRVMVAFRPRRARPGRLVPGQIDTLTRHGCGVRRCRVILRIDAVPAEKIAEPLDLIAQRRKGCPFPLAGGFVVEQLPFPVAQHRRGLEVLGVGGALLVAADLGDLPLELAQARGGAHALLDDRQPPLQRVETAAELRRRLALPAASRG